MTYALWSKAVALFAIVLGIALMVSCISQDQERPVVSMPGYKGGDLANRIGGGGFMSLDERIANFDVIVRGQMQGNVSSTATRDDVVYDAELEHVVWLEFTFNVLEYLKGTGDAQVTAVVPISHGYDSAAEAQAAAVAARALHDTRWDDREAILFLDDDLPARYGSKLRLGWAGPTNNNVDDDYSIFSCCVRRWLPAATSSTGAKGASSRSGSQQFYLESPSRSGAAYGQSSGRSAQSGASTITMTSLKDRIASIEQEIADGGGSDAYRECIAAKYMNVRSTESVKASNDGQYYYHRYDQSLDSGQDSGTVAHRGSYAMAVGDNAPSPGPRSSEFRLSGNDAHLFSVSWPGVVETARPLPLGAYRFFFGSIPKSQVICEAKTSEQLRRHEVYVTVTAPTGTLHEAFFDPVSSGDAVGYFGTGDALKPTSFSIGDVGTTVQSLKWQDSAVTLGLSPYDALAGQILDFITGDGSSSLSLEASAATGDRTAGTLTWAVGSQPWSSGDELMLRIYQPQTTPSFTQDSYTISVAESTSLWSVIGTVKATDQDGDAVLHKITSGDDGGRFVIDGWDGFILLMRKLDYETKSSYELTVTGTDPGGRSATTTVTINVTDVAE